MLLLCGMLLTLAANASSEPKTSAGASSKYIVIDAGSSGCRVHVYTISQQPGQQLPAVELPDKKLKKSPGLSSFAKNPTDAGASLAGLLVFAKQHVPADEHQATPIRLAATAGLRLLPKETSDTILDSCYTYLKENSKFLVTRDKISVISGRDEGAYGWLSINFLLNRLNGMSDAREGTMGSIEMGGASSQVTVQLKGEVIPRFYTPSTSPFSRQHLVEMGMARVTVCATLTAPLCLGSMSDGLRIEHHDFCVPVIVWWAGGEGSGRSVNDVYVDSGRAKVHPVHPLVLGVRPGAGAQPLQRSSQGPCRRRPLFQ